jgi:hypothetical protein
MSDEITPPETGSPGEAGIQEQAQPSSTGQQGDAGPTENLPPEWFSALTDFLHKLLELTMDAAQMEQAFEAIYKKFTSLGAVDVPNAERMEALRMEVRNHFKGQPDHLVNLVAEAFVTAFKHK